MRRRLSLALLAVFVVLAVFVSTQYLSSRSRAVRRTPSGNDTLSRDSAARAAARQEADTMCFASRIGLPCDPR